MGSSRAPQNLSSSRYLPRRTPSTSVPPTFTRRTPCFSKRSFSSWASMARRLPPTFATATALRRELHVGVDHLFVGGHQEEARVRHRFGGIAGAGGGEVLLLGMKLR